MLDLDTLKALNDLTARTLYRAEVAQLPTRTPAEEAALVDRARHGERDAGVALIVSCLPYALRQAVRLYAARRPRHDEILDLAQVASLEMLHHLDKALAMPRPGAYLRGIVKRMISIYITYYGPLIQKPDHFTAQRLIEFGEFPQTERLTEMNVDIVEAPPDTRESEEARQRRFAPLYEALDTLTPRQRAYLNKRYKLGLPLEETGTATLDYDGWALKKLRLALEGHLTQMLSPEPDEE